MNKSESIAALAKALSIAQGELENASKNAENPAFKRGNKASTYADLAEVLNTIRPVFTKYGLSFVQFPTFDAGIASVETMLMHESGEWISSTASSPVTKQDAQGVGSAVTYLRRYAAAAMAGIAQEDDDANSAVGTTAKQEAKPEEKQPSNLTISDEQFKELQTALEETNSDKAAFCKAAGIQSLSAMLAKNFDAAMEKINKKRAQEKAA